MKAFCHLICVALGSLVVTAVTAEAFNAHPSADSISDLLKLPHTNQLPYTGRVLVAIHSSDYTYIEIERDAGRLWLAAPRTRLQKGQKIRFPAGVQMLNFYSKVLQRTFSQILFVRQVRVVAEAS